MCDSYRVIVKRFKKWLPSWTTSRKASRKPLPPSPFTQLPCDVILYMSQFMEFEDYENLIEAVWPDGSEDQLIRQHLWKLSTRTYSTSFFNGKSLEIVYNYNAKRSKKDNILLSVKTLLPITSPIFDKDTDDLWMNPSELVDIVFKQYDMDKCSEYRYANCDCCERLDNTVQYPETFAELTGNECPHEHFHHYCIHHIAWWLTSYLRMSIQIQEKKPALPQDLVTRDNTFGHMLMRWWCISVAASGTQVSY